MGKSGSCSPLAVKWSAVADRLEDALLLCTASGRILFSNRAARRLWAENGGLEGLYLRALFVKEMGLVEDIIAEINSSGTVHGDFLFRKGNEGEFVGALRGCILPTEEGQPVILITVRDLTEQRRAQQRIFESQKLKYLENVLDGLSDEIRNPIVSIAGYAKRLQKLLQEDHPGRALLKVIVEDVERMESILRGVEDYLEFARSHKMSFSKVDLQEVIKEAVALVPRPPNVTLKESYPPQGPWIFGDRTHLRELFRHVIENAAEAMPRGGKVSIRLVSLQDRAKVSIEDSGVGIPEKFLSHIYSPFFTTKPKGAGVGLAKARIIIEEHSGEIEVRSEVAKGTTFEITFPFDRRKTPRRVV